MINVLILNKDINPNNIINKEEYNFIYGLESKEIIECIFKIDIMIVDYFSPCVDFINKIKAIKLLNPKIKVILGISFINESFIRVLYDNGIDYILIKPIDEKLIFILLDKIRESSKVIKLIEINSSLSNNRKINNVLNSLGMPANLKGYSYIKEAIELCQEDCNYYLHTTLYLYPKLSKIFNTKDICIEKAIRSAIELCWCRGNIMMQERIFGYTVDKNKGRPTNGEFLAQLMNYLNSI